MQTIDSRLVTNNLELISGAGIRYTGYNDATITQGLSNNNYWLSRNRNGYNMTAIYDYKLSVMDNQCIHKRNLDVIKLC